MKLVVVLQVEVDGFSGDALGEAAKVQRIVEEAVKKAYGFPTVRIRDFFSLSEDAERLLSRGCPR